VTCETSIERRRVPRNGSLRLSPISNGQIISSLSKKKSKAHHTQNAAKRGIWHGASGDEEGHQAAEEDPAALFLGGHRRRRRRSGRRAPAGAGQAIRRRRVLLLLPAPVAVPAAQGPHLHRVHGEPPAANPAAQRRDKQRGVADPPRPTLGDGALYPRVPYQHRRTPGLSSCSRVDFLNRIRAQKVSSLLGRGCDCAVFGSMV
jgi:hypothetical protein